MIEKVVTKRKLDEVSQRQADLEYWLSRPPEERIQAVFKLRKMFNADDGRIRRVCKVVKLEKS